MNINKIKVGGLYRVNYGNHPFKVTDLLPNEKGYVQGQTLEFSEDGLHVDKGHAIQKVSSRSVMSLWSEYEPTLLRNLAERKREAAHAQEMQRLWVELNTEKFSKCLFLQEVLSDALNEIPITADMDYRERHKWQTREYRLKATIKELSIDNYINGGMSLEPGCTILTEIYSTVPVDVLMAISEKLTSMNEKIIELTRENFALTYKTRESEIANA